MLFTGSAQLTIDSKARLAIPAKYRGQWDPTRDGAAWYCMPWPSGHLRLYTEGRFKILAEQGVGTGGVETLMLPEAVAELETDFFALAERIEPDGAGRIVLPRRHLELSGLKPETEVELVGARVRLEVHDKARWEASIEARFRRLPDSIGKLEGPRG